MGMAGVDVDALVGTKGGVDVGGGSVGELTGIVGLLVGDPAAGGAVSVIEAVAEGVAETAATGEAPGAVRPKTTSATAMDAENSATMKDPRAWAVYRRRRR